MSQLPQNLKVAIVQEGPVYLDLSASMDRAKALIQEAHSQGAGLVVFGETWLSGYPAWLDYCPEVALWDHLPTKKLFAQTYQNSITVPGPETQQLCQMAADLSIVICMGVNEVVHSGPANGTIFNTLLIINEQGEIATHHRKLMPTYTEKLVYGHGDGKGLVVADTKAGRIGGLICWEHWMPLSRQALHDQGEHIHIAVWPMVQERHQIASRQYAFEGRCFVISVGQVLPAKALPENLLNLPEGLASDPEQLLLRGGSCVIGPDGKFLMEPVWEKGGILYHELEDFDKLYRERMTLDVSGHYARRDVFDFKVNRYRAE